VGSLGMTSASAVAGWGTRLYVLDGTQMKVVDVSNPSAPQLLSTWDNYGAQGISVLDNLVVLARPAVNHFDAAGGVYVLNAANASNVTLVEQVKVPGTTRTVALVKGYVYAGDTASVVDVIQLIQ